MLLLSFVEFHMAITVGTDSYISLSDARAYAVSAGLATLPLLDADAETLLKQATTALDRIYGGKYLGMKATIEQKLLWPRTFAGMVPHGTGEWPYILVDSDGNPRDFSGIQPELGYAEVEMASMLQAGTDIYTQPLPFVSMERNKVSALEQEKQYVGAQGYRSDPLYKVALILRPILNKNTGSLSITRGA